MGGDGTAYSAAQANGNNNGKLRGEQTTLASGLRSIFKQIAAAGKAEKSISISYSGKKEKFSLVKGELKAQSAL